MAFWARLKEILTELFVRDIFEYDDLERYRINIEKINRRYEENPEKCTIWGDCQKYCKLFAETDEHRFYQYLAYKDGSGGYILRQEKKKPRRVCYFGQYKGYTCAYKGYLCSAYNYTHNIQVTLIAKHIATGYEYKYWFPCDAYEMPANREGEPLNCWDEPVGIYVSRERLIVEVCRRRREIRKRATPIGEDVDYEIVGTLNGKPFEFKRKFPVWYEEEEQVDAMEALKKFDFSDIKPELC